MNYIRFVKHSLYEPDTYHRRYDQDVEFADNKMALQASPVATLAYRIGTTALPFIALYRPAGSFLSVTLGSCRLGSHLVRAYEFQQNQDWISCSQELFGASFAAAGVVASLAQHILGLFVTTSLDVATGSYRTLCLGWEGEYEKSFKELLEVMASLFYLGFMVTGTLEIILASTVLQGISCLYQSKQELEQGRYIEAAGKMGLAAIKGYQSHQYHQLIKRRDFLHSLKKYQNLIARAERAKRAKDLITNPLHPYLDHRGGESSSSLVVGDQEYDIGNHFHGYGKELVKGGNISMQTLGVNGKPVCEWEFKINHVFRDQLQKTLQELSLYKPHEAAEILQLAGLDVQGISVSKDGSLCSAIDFFASDGKPPEYRVQVGGLGSVFVGASAPLGEDGLIKVPNLYDRIRVRMEEGKNLYDMHALLSLVDLDKAIAVSQKEDLDRLKLGHLFHTLCPREAFAFERDPSFYSMPIDELKGKMVELAPEMEQFYDTYFDKMTLKEVLPGKMRYQITGLSDEIADRGMAYLTSAITGPQDEATLFDRVVSILSMGMLSTEMRDRYQIQAQGLARGGDYMEGGADSVFTQLVPKEVLDGKMRWEDWSSYKSKVRLLYSLKALDLGSYQYLDCEAGNRNPDSSLWGWIDQSSYSTRPNIIELADVLQDSVRKGQPNAHRSHEVMLKERLDPSYFEGIAVSDEQTKSALGLYLEKAGLMQENALGERTILGRLFDQFVRVIPLKKGPGYP